MTVDLLPRTAPAARFSGNRQVVLRERPVPVAGPGELLIEVRANAVCGSDRGLWEAGTSVTPGHETAGVVVAAGAGTTTPIGTLGVVYLMDYCGACRSCLGGYTNQCLAKRADMGFDRDGGYGAYELIHESMFFSVDQDMDPAEATLLLDVMGTTAHALERARLIRPDLESLVVAGAGPIGLGVVAMSRIVLGPAVRVVIADVQPERLRLAEQLGATPIDLRDTTLAAGVAGAGFRDGGDVAIDTTGSASVRDALLATLGRRGVLVCLGHGQWLNVDVSRDLIAPERTILGSEYFPFADLSINLERWRAHRAALAAIVTHRYRLGDLAEALSVFFSGQSGKVVVVP
ncbi:MAG: alcohol dehydrogenase catalytic domain-containing protein [Candidatus Limnocylindrales bacterium]